MFCLRFILYWVIVHFLRRIYLKYELQSSVNCIIICSDVLETWHVNSRKIYCLFLRKWILKWSQFENCFTKCALGTVCGCCTAQISMKFGTSSYFSLSPKAFVHVKFRSVSSTFSMLYKMEKKAPFQGQDDISYVLILDANVGARPCIPLCNISSLFFQKTEPMPCSLSLPRLNESSPKTVQLLR